MLCIFIVSATCIGKQEPALAQTYRQLADQVGLLSLEVGRANGLSDDAFAALGKLTLSHDGCDAKELHQHRGFTAEIREILSANHQGGDLLRNGWSAANATIALSRRCIIVERQMEKRQQKQRPQPVASQGDPIGFTPCSARSGMPVLGRNLNAPTSTACLYVQRHVTACCKPRCES